MKNKGGKIKELKDLKIKVIISLFLEDDSGEVFRHRFCSKILKIFISIYLAAIVQLWAGQDLYRAAISSPSSDAT
jgi:hypothetical protein